MQDTKKNSECCPSNQVTVATMTTSSDNKWPLLIVSQSREEVIVQRGLIRRIGWVIKALETQVGQFLLCCNCPVCQGIVVQEQEHLGELTAAFFLQNVLQLHQQR